MDTKNNYYCPTCSALLNIDDFVVLAVQRENGEGGIIFLDSRLGDYTKVKNSSLHFEKGEVVDLFCRYVIKIYCVYLIII